MNAAAWRAAGRRACSCCTLLMAMLLLRAAMLLCCTSPLTSVLHKLLAGGMVAGSPSLWARSPA